MTDVATPATLQEAPMNPTSEDFHTYMSRSLILTGIPGENEGWMSDKNSLLHWTLHGPLLVKNGVVQPPLEVYAFLVFRQGDWFWAQGFDYDIAIEAGSLAGIYQSAFSLIREHTAAVKAGTAELWPLVDRLEHIPALLDSSYTNAQFIDPDLGVGFQFFASSGPIPGFPEQPSMVKWRKPD